MAASMTATLPVWVVDSILVLLCIEAAALAWRQGRGAHRGRLRGLLANLASGGALLLALRCALAGAAWPVTAVCLLAALCAHVVDLGHRRGPP